MKVWCQSPDEVWHLVDAHRGTTPDTKCQSVTELAWTAGPFPTLARALAFHPGKVCRDCDEACPGCKDGVGCLFPSPCGSGIEYHIPVKEPQQ